MRLDLALLVAPVDDASPCGEDLEYDPAFTALLEAAETKPEQQVGGSVIPAVEPDWPAVARDALALLDRCRDIRVAAILAEATLRTEGMVAFATVLEAVKTWLEDYWAEVHPRLDPEDGDPTMRVNAMAAFGAPETMLRALRATPLTASRAFGRVTWRDLLIATGEMPAPDGGGTPDLAQIGAAFEDTDPAARAATAAAVVAAIGHLRGIDAAFTDRIGTMGPDLSPLDRALRKLRQMIEAHARLEIPAAVAEAAAAMEDDGTPAAPRPAAASAVSAPGTIAGRDDVLRTLERICDYYARCEPSSPVPLLLKRAHRLVNADFATIIRDMASDGYDQVVRITGISEE